MDGIWVLMFVFCVGLLVGIFVGDIDPLDEDADKPSSIMKAMEKEGEI